MFCVKFEGHSYRFDKLVSANTKKRWRCRTRDCNVCIYSTDDQVNSDIQTRTAHRQHRIPDSDARAIELVVSDLKMKARTQLINSYTNVIWCQLRSLLVLPCFTIFLDKLIHQ